MKKLFLIFFLSFSTMIQLEAKVLNAVYSIRYGIFGELGICKAHLETKGNTYVIEVSAETTGVVKRLSKNRREKYVSRGHIVKGVFISDSLDMVRSYSNKVGINHYRIDHQKKKVIKTSIRKRRGKVYQNESRVLSFYAKDDLLTLYFNLPNRINLEKAGEYALPTVGAEKQDGKVKILIPEKKEKKRYEKSLGRGNFHYLTAIVYQKLFQSSQGELMIALGKEGVAEKAVLKDLILYGDLVAKRVK